MIKKRIKSFSYAIKGIRLLFQSELNAKIHLVFAFLAIAAGYVFSINTTEWCFLVVAIAMVLSAEAMNTAIEFLTDLVSPEYHELAEKTKDVAAGAVLITAIGAAIIGAIIFLPKLFDYYSM
ncbi:MAG TPA: diacylglycerol kinase family protein [Phaeodactylibacter sp.]|nr:diacylglycerol kinase family protein [Phaeodactylibacter sp.]